MPSKTQYRAALATSNQQNEELCARLLITTLVAHERARKIPLEVAAAACRLSPNDFLIAGQKVDAEALRMVESMTAMVNCSNPRCGKPNGATVFEKGGKYYCSRDCAAECTVEGEGTGS